MEELGLIAENWRSRGIVKFANQHHDAANTILNSIAPPFMDEGTSQKRKTLLDPVSEPQRHLPTKRAKVKRGRKLSRVEVESTEHDVIDRNSVSEIMVATVRTDQLTTPHQSSSQGRAPPDLSMVPGSASFGGSHDQYSCTEFPVNTGISMGPRTSVDPSPVGVDIFDVLVPTNSVPYSFSDLNAHQPASHDPCGSTDFPAGTGTFTDPETGVDPSSVEVNIFDELVLTEDAPFSFADPQPSVGHSPYNFAGSAANSGTSNGAQPTGDPSSIGLERPSSQPITHYLQLRLNGIKGQ